MTHRAEQIVEAAQSVIATQVGPSGTKVYTHRRYSLAADQDELPAISVDYGEDSPVDEQPTGFFDSILTVEITGVAAAPDEQDVRTELLRLRREAHRAVMADDTLGLSFVVTSSYGGASAPDLDVEGEQVVGELTSAWLVYYRMNLTDPGD